jgi:hypothetical protein
MLVNEQINKIAFGRDAFLPSNGISSIGRAAVIWDPFSLQAETLGLDLLGMNDLNTGIAGKTCSVESENCGEPMHPHRRDQAGIVRGLTLHLMLNDQGFPRRIARSAGK